MNNTPYYVFAKWQVKAGALATVMPLLAEVAQKSAAEPGNLFYQVHQSIADPDTLLLFESYRDEDAAAEHRATAHFQQLVLQQIVPLLAAREVIPAHQLL